MSTVRFGKLRAAFQISHISQSSERGLDGCHISKFAHGEVFMLFSARTVAIPSRELHLFSYMKPKVCVRIWIYHALDRKLV